MNFPIGPLISVGGVRDGIKEKYYIPTLEAGKRPVLFVNDDGGAVDELEKLCALYGIEPIIVFRMVGGGLDVPQYYLPPDEAADLTVREMRRRLPPEVDPTRHWLTIGNEVDHERSNWLGHWAENVALMTAADGWKLAAFNFAAGEPEPEDWDTHGMQSYLRACAASPDDLAVGLHEYSYNNDIKHEAGYQVGRFSQLFIACDLAGIARPQVFITEWGWHRDWVPDREQYILDIKWAASQYAPHNIFAGTWYNGSGIQWGGIQKRLASYFPDLARATIGFVGTELPPVEPPVEPPAIDTIDLATFIVGVPGIQHVLQYDIDDRQGTETLCTLYVGDPDDNIHMQQKDRKVEVIYWDDHHIYRATDTSPGDHEGRKAFYCQYEEAMMGAFWCMRHAFVGQTFIRRPLVIHNYFDNCESFNVAKVASQLCFVAYYDEYQFEGGYHFPHPVVELAWKIDGRVIERYFYGWQLGLVGWKQEEHGWKSYLVEIHEDRLPMDPPAWPSCHPMPIVDALYYRPINIEPPVEPPQPVLGDYVKTYALIHEATPFLYMQRIAQRCIPLRRTCGYSLHDAFEAGLLATEKYVNAWNWPQDERDDFVAWATYYYPDVEIKFYDYMIESPSGDE